MSNETVRKIVFGGGGVNLNASPRAIRDDQVCWAKNTWPDLDGILWKRPGVSVISNAIITALYTCYSFFKPDPITGYKYVAHLRNDNTDTHYLIASSFNAIQNTLVTDAVSLSIGQLGGSAQEPACFANYRGRVIAAIPGVEGFYHLIPKANGIGYEWIKASFKFFPRDFVTSAALAFEQTQNNGDVTPKIAAVYRGRMRYLNLGVGRGHWMVSADAASATHLNVREFPLWALCGNDLLAYNSRHQELDEISGEDISGAFEVTLKSVGTPAEKGFLILTERSGVIITGDLSQTSDTDATDPMLMLGDFKANKINYEVGCASQATIVRTPYGTLWASGSDVWAMYLDASAPVRIGTNIRQALQACPSVGRKFWSAAYANGCYVLSLVTDQSSNSTLEILDKQQWWLDLRQGPPPNAEAARWFGPQEVVRNQPAIDGVLLGPIVSEKRADGSEGVVSLGMDFGTGVNTVLVDYQARQSAYDTLMLDTRSAIRWSPTADVAEGEAVMATSQHHRGRIYIAQNAGVTGGSEPVWPTADSDTVVDGSITWIDILGSPNFQAMQNNDNDYTVPVTVRAKDHDFGVAEREKILRGIEISAGASDVQRIATTMRLDQKRTTALGIPKVGGDDQGQLLAKLGEMVLGDSTSQTSNLAAELQSRMIRPIETARVRGRHLQAEFNDETGFVIDDRNDYLILGVASEGGGEMVLDQNPFGVTIPHGAYGTMVALLSIIEARLNDSIGNYGMGAKEPTAFVFTNAYSGTGPYMNRLKISCDVNVMDGSGTYAFIFGDSDNDEFKFLRCKRLLSLLGYDTNDDLQYNINGDPSEDGEALVSTVIATTTIRWQPAQEYDNGQNCYFMHASSIVPYQKSVDLQLHEAVLIGSVVKGRPFQGQAR